MNQERLLSILLRAGVDIARETASAGCAHGVPIEMGSEKVKLRIVVVPNYDDDGVIT